MMLSRYKPTGWQGESYRHYLAAKGISTRVKYNAVKRTSLKDQRKNDIIAQFMLERDVTFEQAEEMYEEEKKRNFAKKFKIPPRTDASNMKYPIQGDGDHRHDEKNPFGIHRHEDLWTEVNELKADVKKMKAKKASFATKKQAHKYYAFEPTFVSSDLPLIAADGVGTAGAATVSLLPVIVPVALLYGGAKILSNRKKKTGSFFAEKKSTLGLEGELLTNEVESNKLKKIIVGKKLQQQERHPIVEEFVRLNERRDVVKKELQIRHDEEQRARAAEVEAVRA